MKKAVISGNVVEGKSFFDKFKYERSVIMDDEMRNDVAVSMKGMLGNRQALAVRVAAT